MFIYILKVLNKNYFYINRYENRISLVLLVICYRFFSSFLFNENVGLYVVGFDGVLHYGCLGEHIFVLIFVSISIQIALLLLLLLLYIIFS